jgi:invasion protein IalB
MPNRMIQFLRGARPALAAAALLMGVPVTVMAQDAPAGGDVSQWIKVCNPKQQTDCAVTKDYVVETGPLATFTIRTTTDPKKFIVGVTVPPGFIFPPGIPVSIDGAKKTTAHYLICWPDAPKSQHVVCIAQAEVADNFVASMKKGGKLELQLTSGDASVVPVNFSLGGFSKVFDGPDMGEQALAKQRDELAKMFQQKAQQRGQQLIDAQRKNQGGG